MTVLPPVHLPILFQRLIESPVLNQVAFTFRDLIGHDKTVIGKHPHDLVLDAQDQLFPHQGMGNNVAVALEADGAVLVDLPVDPPGGIELPSGTGFRCGRSRSYRLAPPRGLSRAPAGP